jgi:hypothetical protein
MTRRSLAALLAVALLPTVIVADDVPVPAPALPAAPVAVPDLTGEWGGYWVSCTNGHRGPLRATFCRVGDNCYQVRFKGRFALIVPFRYATPMAVTGVGDGFVTLAASRTLGPVLGTFSMSAAATCNQFDATFTSKKDAGKFVLTRVGCSR